MLFSFAALACKNHDSDPNTISDPKTDETLASPGTDPAVAEATIQTPVDRDPQATHKQIVLAGGCFWCVEAVYERVDGILDVESGYAGGSEATANYEAVSRGDTKHAEVVRITYDSSKITLGQIYKLFFSVAHDPTTLNRQGADVGTQYRSAIFYANDEQKQIAEAYIQQLTEEGAFSRPIVTTLEPLEQFFVAETYHQDFATNNPDHRYIRAVSDPKVQKLEATYGEMLKGNQPAAEDASAE